MIYNTKRVMKCQVCYIYSSVLVAFKLLSFKLDIVGSSSQRDIVVATASTEGRFSIEKTLLLKICVNCSC